MKSIDANVSYQNKNKNACKGVNQTREIYYENVKKCFVYFAETLNCSFINLLSLLKACHCTTYTNCCFPGFCLNFSMHTEAVYQVLILTYLTKCKIYIVIINSISSLQQPKSH